MADFVLNNGAPKAVLGSWAFGVDIQSIPGATPADPHTLQILILLDTGDGKGWRNATGNGTYMRSYNTTNDLLTDIQIAGGIELYKSKLLSTINGSLTQLSAHIPDYTTAAAATVFGPTVVGEPTSGDQALILITNWLHSRKLVDVNHTAFLA